MRKRTRMPRRRAIVAAIAGAGITTLLAASGCSGGTTTNERQADTIRMVGPGGPTWVRNFNVYSPAPAKSPNLWLLYEPLLRVDYADGGAIKPWLAKEWEFTDGGRTLTFTIRPEVTWSDGKPFTVDDVVFSLELPLKNPQFNAAGVSYTSVTAEGSDKVAVHYPNPTFTQLAGFGATALLIVPKHLWAAQDLTTWTNPDPVGSGPFALADFTSQRVRLKARSDYWGGKPPMKFVEVAATTGTGVQAQLLNGELDWANAPMTNGAEQFVGKNPKTNKYETFRNGSTLNLNFNTAMAPYSDVHVRRALAAALDRKSLLTLADTGQTLTGPTGMDPTYYADWITEKYKNVNQEQDVTFAKSELQAGGFTVENGRLVKDGRSYELSLLLQNDYADWVAYSAGMKDQWKRALGLDVKLSSQPAAAYDSDLRTGQFGMAMRFGGGGTGPYAIYATLDSRFYLPIGQKAAANVVRWKDTTTDQAIANLSSTDDPAKQKAAAQTLQQIQADQVPISPLFAAVLFVDINASRWVGWPTSTDYKWVPHPVLGPDTILTLLNLKPATR